MNIRATIVRLFHARGKNSALYILIVMVVCVQIFRFMQLTPRLAEVSAATPGENAEKLVETLPRDTGDIREYRALMQHAEQVVQTFKTFPTTRPAESRALAVNPFREHRSANVSANRAEQERTETLTAAQTLTLQSIMPSEVAPVCLINNILLRQQQEVNGFTVDKIGADTVIVHRGNFRFELRLLK